MKPILTVFCLLILIGARAQDNTKPSASQFDSVFTSVEIEATYPGGPAAWLRFLNKHFAYPEDAIQNKITGTVVIQFIVDKQGNTSDIKAISGPEKGGLREEAERVIRISGRWNPAIQQGHQVASYKKQPIVFMIGD